MKVAIITFHFAHNYGAVLQAYALQEKIHEMGHRVEIIDFRPETIRRQYKLFQTDSSSPSLFIKYLVFGILNFGCSYRRWKNFNSFIERELRLTKDRYHTPEVLVERKPKADVYICGSDQIWNSSLTGGMLASYFLDFVTDGQKKVSYAASFGKDAHSGPEGARIAELVRSFSSISVRELEGVRVLHELGVDDVSVVLDPVFLHKPDFWERRLGKNTVRRDYLLVYAMEEAPALYETARKIADKKNLIMVNITGNRLYDNGEDEKALCIGPSEFVKLFNGATYIVTNSYHGTVFSILFRKNFTIIPGSNHDLRIGGLLSLIGLEGRTGYDNARTNDIDYTSVQQRLDKLRDNSLTFLRLAIEGSGPTK